MPRLLTAAALLLPTMDRKPASGKRRAASSQRGERGRADHRGRTPLAVSSAPPIRGRRASDRPIPAPSDAGSPWTEVGRKPRGQLHAGDLAAERCKIRRRMTPW